MEAEKLIEKLSQEQNESSKVVRIALAYAEFASLVKRMREAQSDYEIIDMAYEYAKDHRCADRELVLQRAEAMTKAIKLEDEVDEHLKKMEI